MAITLLRTRFPDIAAAETRSITVFDGDRLPLGSYGLLEFFCDDIDCDCRRAIITVVGETTGNKAWATISYGWESPEFYGDWMNSAHMVEPIDGAFLDPLGGQSEYAKEFLDYFLYMLQTDPAYNERIQRHYWMFKASLNKEPKQQQSRKASGGWTAARKGRLRKR